MNLEKKCNGCKKMLKPENFVSENREKPYSKCNTCRAKLINRKNFCNVCGKGARFNKDGETFGKFCDAHKEPGMINVKSKTCIEKSCRKRANYNIPGKLPEYCLRHKKTDMISSPRKKCVFKDCNELAIFGITTQRHCETHQEKDEYNLVERTCQNPNCNDGKPIIDILNKDGVCVSFCSMLKQDEIMKKHMKKKEEFIGKLLIHEIPKLPFYLRDEVVDKDCSSSRPDFVYHLGTHILIIEVDEYQHRSYRSCGHTKQERMNTENRRMFELYQSFEGLPVIFIRYNPDTFKDENGKIYKISEKKRQEIFSSWVKNFIRSDEKYIGCNVKYLFYDCWKESDTNFNQLTEKDVL